MDLQAISIDNPNGLNLIPGQAHFIKAVDDKLVPEVCRVFCATANPVQVVVAETEQGRGFSV